MLSKPTVAYFTLGCKLNFSETSTISRQFSDAGYTRVDFEEEADVYVINTCSVTENANKKCRQIVKKAKKSAPDSTIAVIGCYAQLKPKEISAIEGVDIVLGAGEKFNIVEYVSNHDKESCTTQVHMSDALKVNEFIPSFSVDDRTRSFFKVQDGCDYFCSFCTIPLARGLSRSDSIEQTMQKAREVAETAVREIVLTGVNIGDFGKSNNETFLDLIKELDELENIDRIRISSIEPNLLGNEIIEFVASSRLFVPHFHIPLQSGSDKILNAMRRKYNSALYKERITKIKSVMPDCCIGVDVITGFPGESKEDFLETYDFLNNLDVSYLHVFTYSERPDTTALRIKEVVPLEERRERTKMLQILSEKKRRHFYNNFLNTSRPVLFEKRQADGSFQGYTDNYIKVQTNSDKDLENKILDIALEQINSDALVIGAEPELYQEA